MADDFLSALGTGLRGAGAILSPAVYQQSNVELDQRQAQTAQMRQYMAQQLVRGIETGSVDPNAPQVQQALVQLGIPPAAFRASPQAQLQQNELQQYQEFQKYLSGQVPQGAAPQPAATPPARPMGGSVMAGGMQPAGAFTPAGGLAPEPQPPTPGMQPSALMPPPMQPTGIPPQLLANPFFQQYMKAVAPKYEKVDGDLYSIAPGQPPQKVVQGTKYEERDMPGPNDTMQKQFRNNPQEPWQNLGSPTHKFAKQVVSVNTGGSNKPRDYDTVYSDLSPASQTALDAQAWNYMTKGTLPYRKGTGGGADRNDMIIWRAGAIANDLGMSPQEFSGKSAEFKANAQTLATMTKKLNSVQGTLESFHNNIATWDSIAKGEAPKIGGAKLAELGNELKKMDFSDVKTLNDWKLKIESQFNDPSAVAYLTAAMTVAMDYSRILSSQGQSAAAVTEGARNEAIKLVSAGYNEKARKALIGTLESDAAGQIKGLETQTNRLRKKLGLRAEESTADPAPAPKPIVPAPASQAAIDELVKKYAK